VQERCTCGAYLPEGARFCHKCGRPLFEEDAARLAAQEAATPATPGDAAPHALPRVSAVGFRNVQAVLITMAVAAISLVALCAAAVVAPVLGPLVLCAAGFAATKLYKSRSSEALSTGSGAYLGLMTGLWLFLVVAACAAITSVYVSSPEGREMMKAAMPRMPEIAKLLDNPHRFVISIFEGLVPTFFIATISAAFGGMLAARSSARRRQS